MRHPDDPSGREILLAMLAILGVLGLMVLATWGLYAAGQEWLVPWIRETWRHAVRDACRGGKCR
jgi:hypothetical protein